MSKPLVSIRQLEFTIGMNRAFLRRMARQSGRHYRPFDMRRHPGAKWRHIDNPVGDLKDIQRRIDRHVLSKVSLPDSVNGSVRNRSTTDNARIHTRASRLVTIDLRDCFPSISHRHVYDALRAELGCSPEIASLLTRLTTVGGRLPQGAPTSPMLANLVLLPLYDDLERMAAARGCAASYYIDDLAFSGPRVQQLIGPAIRVIQRHGYAVRHAKVRYMPSWVCQLVTGIVVNRKLSIPRTYRRAVRAEVFALSTMHDPPQHRLNAVRSRIAHVASVNPLQAAPLVALSERLLPVVGSHGERSRVSERRSCSGARNHRRRVRQ